MLEVLLVWDNDRTRVGEARSVRVFRAGLACCMEGSVPRILVLPNCQNRKETGIKAGNLAGQRSYVSVFWFSTKYLFQATHTQSAIKPAHKLCVPGQVVKNL